RTRERGRRAAWLPGDLAQPAARDAQKRDLLALRERQIPPRQRGLSDRWHSATLPQPPDADRPRHTRLDPGILAAQPTSNRRPKPLTMLPTPHRRTPRRTHHRPPRPIRRPP